ncbi:hypothetical protein [Marinobacter shengliensis]|uniref:hypothetical protein n=1 Tax=Marinobacter shengliensis TaxID=1389223 RepID=UPI001E2A0C0F|nr:hypothetical protein [Marinobacter shengliensis]MCD1628465.1 hypothetical protein [Marinobacter shengliensis]
MSKPITWRTVGSNVAAPNLGAVSDILGQSQQDFNQAFNSLDNLFARRQQIETGNQENQVRLNTDDFEAQLRSRFQTPEQLQAAQQSGELDALRQQYGQYGLDTERTDAAAIDGLVSSMQSRQLNQFNYDEQVRNQEMNPLMQEYLAEANSWNPDMGLADRANAQQDMAARIFADLNLDAKARNALLSQLGVLRNNQDEGFISRQNYFRSEEDRRKAKEADQILIDDSKNRLESQRSFDETQAQYTQQLADTLGIGVNDLGDRELVQQRLNEASPEAVEKFNRIRQEQLSMADPRNLEGDGNRALFERLVPLVGLEEAVRLTQLADEQVFGLESPTARGREQELRIRNNYETEVARNSYYKDEQMGQSPAEITATLSEQLANDERFREQWWGNRDSAFRFINAAASGQYAINGKDPVPIPTEYIRAALFQMEPGFINDRTAIEAIEAVVGNADLGKELEDYQRAKQNRDSKLNSLRVREMGRLPGNEFQNIVRGLDFQRQELVPQQTEENESAPVTEPVQETRQAVQTPMVDQRIGFLGVDRAAQAQMQERQNRQAERARLQQTLRNVVDQQSNSEQINKWVDQLSRTRRASDKQEISRQLLRSLPDIVFANANEAEQLADVPRVLLDAELRRRGMK